MSSPPTLPVVPRVVLSQAWRPWSIPVDIHRVQRRLRGLLNKITAANFDSISDNVVALAASVERTGDTRSINIFAYSLVERSILDENLTGVLVKLCQKLVDELEGERIRWRTVDPYHVGNLMHSIEGSLQVHALRKFEDAMMQGRTPDFFALARFVGELTVNGIVFATDLEGVLDLLFSRTEGNDDDHAVALCRFLSPVVVAPEASQCLEALSIVGRIENVLEEDAISQKIRYMMMNMLEQALYPKPRDAFASVEQRTEVYGFGQEANDYGDFNEERKESDARETVLHYCREQTSHFLLSRNVTQAEDSFQKLPSRDRHHLVARLVSVALSSDDCSDTTLAASLFSLPSVRSLCQSRNSFVKGFEAEIVMLEDTALDVPLAYRRMATMLHASGLTQNVVEDLASRITIRENSARDRLLEEYLSVGRDAGDTAKSETAYDDNDGLVSEFEENVDIVGDADGQVSGSDEGAPSVECAFAY